MADQDERTTTLTEFVAACLERHRPPDRPLPVILLLGRRGTGKTTLLDRVNETLSEPRPRARLDLGHPGADPDPVAILAGLMSQLHAPVKFVGSIPFPRFGLGLLALDLNPADRLAERRSQLDALLERRGASPINARLRRVLYDLTGNLNLRPDQQVVVAAAEWVAELLISFIKHRRIENLRGWYASRDAASGGAAQDTLYQLCEWRAGKEWAGEEKEWAGGEIAWRAEKTLCAAFLADLRAYFDEPQLRRPWQPVTNCLVLLDNTGGPKGTRFLETLVECRAEIPGAGDPLVVVAGHHTRPEDDLRADPPVDARLRVGPPIDAASPGLDHKRWLEKARELPDPPLWFPVRLSDLDDDGMQRMVPSRVLDGKHGHDADFIHAITGGHLGVTAELASALVNADSEGEVGPRALLAGHDRLLRSLFPAGDVDDKMLNAMAVCAATPGLRLAACNAAFRSLRRAEESAWPQDAWQARSKLIMTMWADERNDDLILHPLPRRLLLRRLAGDPALWKQVHEGFQAHYAAVGNETVRWYHKLACEEPGAAGELDQLIRRMDSRLVEPSPLDPLEWCDELDKITAAPNMLRTRDDQGNVVTDLAGPAPQEGLDRRQAVARLIVAQWLYQDRLFDPRHKLAVVLAREYQNLADCVTPHGDVFGRRAGQFGKIARAWGWTV